MPAEDILNINSNSKSVHDYGLWCFIVLIAPTQSSLFLVVAVFDNFKTGVVVLKMI